MKDVMDTGCPTGRQNPCGVTPMSDSAGFFYSRNMIEKIVVKHPYGKYDNCLRPVHDEMPLDAAVSEEAWELNCLTHSRELKDMSKYFLPKLWGHICLGTNIKTYYKFYRI